MKSSRQRCNRRAVIALQYEVSPVHHSGMTIQERQPCPCAVSWPPWPGLCPVRHSATFRGDCTMGHQQAASVDNLGTAAKSLLYATPPGNTPFEALIAAMPRHGQAEGSPAQGYSPQATPDSSAPRRPWRHATRPAILSSTAASPDHRRDALICLGRIQNESP